jgi:hypothetical protein
VPVSKRKSAGRKQADPARGDAQNVSVREQQDVAVEGVPSRDHTRSTLAPTCSGISPPGHPSRKISQAGVTSWMSWGVFPSYSAVVPFRQIRIDNHILAEARQLAGLSRPLHWAAKRKP